MNNEPVRPDDETEPVAARNSTSDSALSASATVIRREHSRFRPGQSGNPNGRPKGRRSFKKDITVALDAVSRAEHGKTKQQTLAETLVNDALAGNSLALKILTAIALALDGDEGESEGEAATLQQRLIEDFDHREASTESMDGGENEPDIS